MNSRGFTLIEVLLVTVILGIVLAIGTLNFHSWQRKAQIERQTRELFTDLNAARTESLFSKKQHGIVINSAATGFVFRRYSSENDSVGTVVFNRSFTGTVTRPSGSSLADKTIVFDTRGFTSNNETISFSTANTDAAVDCIIISAGRTNMGKMTNGQCVNN